MTNIYYIGAYLEIITTEVEVITNKLGCPNNHKLEAITKFCSECGKPIDKVKVVQKQLPTLVYPHLLKDNNSKNLLLEMSYGFRFNKDSCEVGVLRVIPVGNKSSRYCWLYLDDYYSPTLVEPFPDALILDEMKGLLERDYINVIEALKHSPNVINVAIKLGYLGKDGRV